MGVVRSDIIGSEKLTDVFGYWPSFHDAEVLELTLTDIASRQMEAVKFEVRFHGAFGLGAEFVCRAVEVVSVEMGIPDGSVYRWN